MPYNIRIRSTGIHIPEKVITNSDLESLVHNFDSEKAGCDLNEWILDHYGIAERRWSDELPSEQAILACQNALQNANMNVEEIDLLLLNTAFGDTTQPTTATQIQKGLAMRPNTFAMELNSPCAGSVFGMVTAMHFINSGDYKNALVVGVDKMTSLIDTKDFKMAGLFGEGAGACVVSQSSVPGILGYHLGSKGEEGEPTEYALRVLGGRARFPFSKLKMDLGFHFLQMNGKKVEGFVEDSFKDSLQHVLSKASLTIADIDHVVTHQASKKMIVNALKSAGIDTAKAVFTIRELGNTSAASLLITLNKLFQNTLKDKETILLLGMGGGLNWGGILYQHTQE